MLNFFEDIRFLSEGETERIFIGKIIFIANFDSNVHQKFWSEFSVPVQLLKGKRLKM